MIKDKQGEVHVTMAEEAPRTSTLVEEKDKGWCWFALLGTTLANFLIFGFVKSSGVLYVGLMEEFNLTRKEASWPFTICESFFNLFAPFWSFVFFYWHSRTVGILCGTLIAAAISACYFANSILFIIICLGVIQGICISAMVIAYPNVINSYFDKKKAIAVGITMAGSGLGGFCIPHLINSLYEQYGLHRTFFIAGCISGHIVLAALFYKTPKWAKSLLYKPSYHSVEEDDQSRTSSEQQEEQKFRKLDILLSLLKTPLVYLISFTFMVFEISNQIFTNVIVDYAIYKAIESSSAVWFISAYSIGDLAGGLFWGWWFDKNITTKTNLTIFGIITISLSWVILAIFQNYYVIVLICFLLGLFKSILLVSCHVLVIDLTNSNSVSACFGIMRFLTGIFLFAKSPLIGLFRDTLKNYDYLAYCVGALYTVLLLPWLVQLYKEKRSPRLDPKV